MSKRQLPSPVAKIARRTKDTHYSSFITPPEFDPIVEGTALTVSRHKFVAAYLGEASGNAPMATRIALGVKADGMSAQAIGARACAFMGCPRVQEGLALGVARLRMSADWAKATLVDVASANMTNFLEVNLETGTATLDFAKALRNGAISQIKELTQETETTPEGNVHVTTKLKLHEKTPALIALLKMHGMLAEHVKHSGVINLRPMTFDGDKEAAQEFDESVGVKQITDQSAEATASVSEAEISD
jgi:hypothetical protein